MRLGMIGYGAIGREVAAAWRRGDLGPQVELAAALVRRPRSADEGLLVTNEAGRFFEQSLDVVLECAGHQAVREHGARCLEARRRPRAHLDRRAGRRRAAVRIEAAAATRGAASSWPPPGSAPSTSSRPRAVGGLDRVAMTVRKDPSAWYGTEAESLCDLASLARAVRALSRAGTRGSAPLPAERQHLGRRGARRALAWTGRELAIVADPTIRTHVVEIEAKVPSAVFASPRRSTRPRTTPRPESWSRWR